MGESRLQHTDAMGARTLAIALGSQLIALIARSANAPSNGSAGAITARPWWSWAIWMLTVLVEVISVHLAILMNFYVLGQLLQGVLRSVGERV
jgi:hypothetical protein